MGSAASAQREREPKPEKSGISDRLKSMKVRYSSLYDTTAEDNANNGDLKLDRDGKDESHILSEREHAEKQCSQKKRWSIGPNTSIMVNEAGITQAHGEAMIRTYKPRIRRKIDNHKHWEHCLLHLKGRKLYVYLELGSMFAKINEGQPYAVFKLSSVHSYEISKPVAPEAMSSVSNELPSMTVLNLKFMEYLHKDDLTLGFYNIVGGGNIPAMNVFNHELLTKSIKKEQIRGREVREKFAKRMMHENQHVLRREGRKANSIAKIATTHRLKKYLHRVEARLLSGRSTQIEEK